MTFYNKNDMYLTVISQSTLGKMSILIRLAQAEYNMNYFLVGILKFIIQKYDIILLKKKIIK